MVYHSHTSTEAYPSRTDISLAAEPQAHYLLVSLAESGSDDGPPEVRSFRITGRRGHRGRDPAHGIAARSELTASADAVVE